MTAVVRAIGNLERFRWWLAGWRGFPLPEGDHVPCPKATDRAAGAGDPIDWRHMAGDVVPGLDGHRVNGQGIAGGMPIQNGSAVTRVLWWGAHGHSRAAVIPRPVAGRYWTTGYPNPYFDVRCIIAGPDPSEVCEIIQFDQDAPRRANGLPQQALSFGRFRNGELVEGRAITAAQIPGHLYLWGPASAAAGGHQQALVIDDYVGGDGDMAEGPRCGDWYVLDRGSWSYRMNVALGGEAAARAEALATFGCRLIDRNGESHTHPPPWLLTQAGRWTARTNSHLFRLALADLRLAIDPKDPR